MSKIEPCRRCSGTGKTRDGLGRNDCEWCGGVGLRKRCGQVDCYEFGCSHGLCYVSRQEAEAHRAEIAALQAEDNGS